MFIFLRETYPIALLNKKAKRLRKETGNSKLRSAEDLGLTPAELLKVSIYRPIKLLLFSPIVLCLSVYIAFVYGLLYLLFTTITSVFTDIYHFSQGLAGLAYLGIGIGMFLGVFIVGASSDRLLKKLTAANNGVVKPEYRLPPMMVAGLILPLGLFLYGWTAEYKVHWIVPIIGMGLVGLGLIGSFVSLQTPLFSPTSVQILRFSDPMLHLPHRCLLEAFGFSGCSKHCPALAFRRFDSIGWAGYV